MKKNKNTEGEKRIGIVLLLAHTSMDQTFDQQHFVEFAHFYDHIEHIDLLLMLCLHHCKWEQKNKKKMVLN